jgi:hypothetical protein
MVKGENPSQLCLSGRLWLKKWAGGKLNAGHMPIEFFWQITASVELQREIHDSIRLKSKR